MRSDSRTPHPTPLSPAVFHILLALAAETRHGYGIIQEVERRTEGQVQLGPGTLYGAIRRLREGRLIEEMEVSEGDERRRLYRLTPGGIAVARAEARRLERLVEQARALELIPGPGGT